MAAPSRTRDVFRALANDRSALLAQAGDVLEAQVRLAEIPAPTGQERARADAVAADLRRLGHSVEFDSAGNVLAWVPGRVDEAPVVVCAHLDTVFPGELQHRVQRLGTRLVGPGISDNARGLAALLAVASRLGPHARRTRRPLLLAATTGEEGDGDLRGSRHLFGKAARGAHAAIAIDGAGDDRVVTHALGCVRLRLTLRGPGGHSWAAFGLPNPIHAIGVAVARIAALPLSSTPRATLTVSRIGGGTAVNAIPREAWIDVDIRSTSDGILQRLADEVQREVRGAVAAENDARSGHRPLDLTVVATGRRPAGIVPEHAPLAQSACDATRAIGRVPQLAVASTDANVPISLGIPAIAIGAGGGAGNTHTPDEWFDATDAHLGIERALTIVAEAADLS